MIIGFASKESFKEFFKSLDNFVKTTEEKDRYIVDGKELSREEIREILKN